MSEDTCENDDEMVDVVDDERSTCFRPLLHPMPRKIIEFPACEFRNHGPSDMSTFVIYSLSEMRIFLLTHENVQ